MIKEIEELKAKISSNLNEILELKNSLKQKELEKQDLTKEFFLGIIDIIDSYENKERSLFDKHQGNQDATKIIESFSVIRKKLLSILLKYGVTRIEFPENKMIMGFSKIIETEPDLERKNDSIISVVRHGYIRGHELIREAELIIVKN